MDEVSNPRSKYSKEERTARAAYFRDQAKSGSKPVPSRKTSSSSNAGSSQKASSGPKPSFFPPAEPVGSSYATALGAGVPCFRPGAFPVIFSTGVGQPMSQVHFGVDASTVVKTVESHLDDVERDPRMVSYEYQLPSEQERVAFKKAYKAAGVMCAAQSLVLSHTNAKFPMGDFSSVSGAQLPHVRSLRTAMSQYGDFSHSETGMRVTPYHYEGEVRRLVRLANDIVTSDDEVSTITLRAWLPSQVNDGAFVWLIAMRLAELMRMHVSASPPISVIARSLFKVGDRPPDWFLQLKECLDEATRPLVDFLIRGFPADATAVLTLFTGDEGRRRLDLFDLAWPNPRVEHLHWAQRANELATVVTEKWATYATFMERIFHISTKVDFAGQAVGSPMQFALVCEPAPSVTVLRMVLATQPGVQSLATAFPCTSYWDRASHEPLATSTSSVLVAETRTHWVQSDLK